MYLHEDKELFFDVVNAASEKLNIPMAVIESDKDYNCYIFAYDPLDGYVEESLYPGVKLETAFLLQNLVLMFQK